MKTNVLDDRANVHSPRAFLSELTLDYHEIQAFSWRLLREYLFQLLTCRLSNSYDVNMVKNCLDSWMTNHPNAQSYLSPSLLPHWQHGLRTPRCSCDGHVSFILDPDWFWEVTKIRFEIIISQASHVFSDEIFNSFLLINRYFSFLQYSYVLSIWKLTCLVCCLRQFDWRDIHWRSGVHDLFFQLDKSSLSPKMHAKAQPFNYIKSLLVKRKF